jgi:hypothetical protein
MAISRNEVQITWPTASNSTTITSGSNATSEPKTFSATAIRAGLTVKADNSGTPASGDTVDVWIIYTDGDPDGASTDEYGTTGHARFLGQLDTNVEDKALLTFDISAAHKGFKLYAENNAGSNSIVVSATMTELLAA